MENHLIVGIKITEAVQEQLDRVLDAHKFYFQTDDPDYLQIHRVNGERVLGKKLQAGVAFATLQDYVANVNSIILKICPESRVNHSDIKVFAQTLIG